MQTNSANKTCMTCGRSIKGRSDKKFCDDYCRSSFNNRAQNDMHPGIRQINSILRKNRRILQELIPEETAKATKERLEEKGFNFQYVTNTLTNTKGMIYFFCYEYGYLPLENDWYFLVKRT